VLEDTPVLALLEGSGDIVPREIELCDNVPRMTENEEKMTRFLSGVRTIALVGASPNPSRPSNTVMRYLIGKGYDVIPVRPKVSKVLDRTCYSSLEEIPHEVDIVDVFRKPEACPEVARSAVAIRARMLWLQLGIVSEDAARIAGEAGLEVVMDRCIKTVHEELGL
jgi:hypothetical protein